MATGNYKVLVNCSTLVKGGALQVAAAMIVHALKDPNTADWQYMVSRNTANELEGFGIDTTAKQFHIFHSSPARSGAARKRVLAIEAEVRPDLVFTLFGPAYVRFANRHLCGVADPWVTHSSWLAFKTLGFNKDSVLMLGLMFWKAVWWKTADYCWTEAPVAKDGLISRLRFKEERVFIIPNTVGPQFEKAKARAKPPGEGKFRILCLSAYYWHKNLEIIPDVLKSIKDLRPKLDFELTVTLPAELKESAAIVKRAEELGVTEHLNNLGRIPVSETPALYEQSHIAFLPSLLEVFSAVYPESMSTGLPLVTTNLRFATDACKDAAAYFMPTNADDAAKKIIRLAEDREYWERKSARGLEIYSELPNAQQKWDLQKDVIMKVASL